MPATGCSAAAAVRQTVFFYQPSQLEILSLDDIAAIGLPGPQGWQGLDPFAACVLPDANAGAALSSVDGSPTWDFLTWDPATAATSIGADATFTDLEIGADFLNFPDYIPPPPPSMPNISPSIPSLPSHDLPSASNSPPFHPSATHSTSHSPPTTTPSSTSGAPALPPHRQDRESSEVAQRRQRNTIAARKYRQKKVDRIEELEKALEETIRERDELRLRLARQEAETKALKSVMRMGKESPSKGD
ncbi:hypothetical protein VdG2_08485 [Verticillium dahliae VDG2]|nr:hypothetical protein VdG2_08485 [Verticillium dahliae VDG2]